MGGGVVTGDTRVLPCYLLPLLSPRREGAVSAILKKVEKKWGKIVIFRFFRDTIYMEGMTYAAPAARAASHFAAALRNVQMQLWIFLKYVPKFLFFPATAIYPLLCS